MEYRLKTDSSTTINNNGDIIDMTKVIKTNGVDAILDLYGNDVTANINLVKKSEVEAVDADITDIETNTMPSKLTKVEYNAMVANKISINDAVDMSQTLDVISATPVTGYNNKFEYGLTTMTVVINNYDSNSTYDIITDIGEVTLNTTTGIISIIVTEVSVTTPKSITIVSNVPGKLMSDPLNINLNIEPIPYVSDQMLVNNNLKNNATLRVNI